MTVHYTETERAGLNASLYVDVQLSKDRKHVTCVQVWRRSPYGDVLQVSFPAFPCPDVARLNAYRWITQEVGGARFHAWEPQHVKQIAEAETA